MGRVSIIVFAIIARISSGIRPTTLKVKAENGRKIKLRFGKWPLVTKYKTRRTLFVNKNSEWEYKLTQDSKPYAEYNFHGGMLVTIPDSAVNHPQKIKFKLKAGRRTCHKAVALVGGCAPVESAPDFFVKYSVIIDRSDEVSPLAGWEQTARKYENKDPFPKQSQGRSLADMEAPSELDLQELMVTVMQAIHELKNLKPGIKGSEKIRSYLIDSLKGGKIFNSQGPPKTTPRSTNQTPYENSAEFFDLISSIVTFFDSGDDIGDSYVRDYFKLTDAPQPSPSNVCDPTPGDDYIKDCFKLIQTPEPVDIFYELFGVTLKM